MGYREAVVLAKVEVAVVGGAGLAMALTSIVDKLDIFQRIFYFLPFICAMFMYTKTKSKRHLEILIR